jgi:hypothetical protein
LSAPVFELLTLSPIAQGVPNFLCRTSAVADTKNQQLTGMRQIYGSGRGDLLTMAVNY